MFRDGLELRSSLPPTGPACAVTLEWPGWSQWWPGPRQKAYDLEMCRLARLQSGASREDRDLPNPRTSRLSVVPCPWYVCSGKRASLDLETARL